MIDIQNSTAFFRDKFVPFNEANISIASSPVLYGLSVYSVFDVTFYEGKLQIFRLKEHYQRLCNSAQILDFDSFANEWPWERFESTMLELLKHNSVQEDVLVRVSVFIDEIAANLILQPRFFWQTFSYFYLSV